MGMHANMNMNLNMHPGMNNNMHPGMHMGGAGPGGHFPEPFPFAPAPGPPLGGFRGPYNGPMGADPLGAAPPTDRWMERNHAPAMGMSPPRGPMPMGSFQQGQGQGQGRGRVPWRGPQRMQPQEQDQDRDQNSPRGYMCGVSDSGASQGQGQGRGGGPGTGVPFLPAAMDDIGGDGAGAGAGAGMQGAGPLGNAAINAMMQFPGAYQQVSIAFSTHK
jgi:hypothetical protein